ncbi:hypothetical protein GCM10011504_22520 [Siccirubricoccus deserti]|uniref:Uncharacterized protein n=1 Tax=Siccirubricoccus deserti TaxID=2013562 RepID=A0A9X0QYZ9_9PROT|nr:halocarboxylic acid dehydrogenase DehI family protein [Siccirubricoccus deserti]MBC4015667.1 hypothetical protein [Siccirubricoccus deserti]GGC43565.1 hypothetical protein GCM10011504_22520 [Siccirubricoccus deserti]
MALAELREAEAPPEIAALYAALRQASGVPLVNLIHRHLATLPGVLPWVWQAIRPPLETGTLAAARLRLAAALPAPPAPLPAADWAAAGLAPEQRATIRALVEVYDRGNLTNLILLTALRRTLEGEPLAAVAPPAAIAPPPMLPAPLPLPRLEALAPPVAALVRGLAARHGEAGVVPSLYLHLAHWPELLAALPLWLGPRLAPEALAAGRAAAVRLAEAEADALRPALDIRGAVPGGQAPAVLAALGTFTRQVIPGMVPLGLILAGLLEPFHAD